MNSNYHCGNALCRCSHTHGCEMGWIWGNFEDTKIVKSKDGNHEVRKNTYESVSPCPNCDPDKAEIFLTSKNRWELMEALQQRSKSNRHQAYDNREESKTRTL